jgi:hypothetical protein
MYRLLPRHHTGEQHPTTGMDMDMEDTDEGHGLPTRRAIIIITVPNQDLPTSATTPLHLINPSPPRRELQQHPQSQVSATHYHANRPPQQM